MRFRQRFVPLLLMIVAVLGIVSFIAFRNPGKPTSHGGDVRDYVSLVDKLRTDGAVVSTQGPVLQPFLNVSGQLVRVDNESIQVYQYENAVRANSDASKISSDGSHAGTSIIDWTSTPHIYKKDRIVVIYVGQNLRLQKELASILIGQFAGQ